MALTVTLHTAGELPSPEAIARWLTGHGEPFEAEDDGIALRALPLRIAVRDARTLTVAVDLRPDTAVARAVDLIYDLSVVAGADVRLGDADLTRAALWLRLADEQDRLRIRRALEVAAERGVADDVSRKLWAVIAALHPGIDARWSTDLGAIVEIDDAEGVLLQADADTDSAALVPRRLHGAPHLLAWRWLSEAWPSLTDA